MPGLRVKRQSSRVSYTRKWISFSNFAWSPRYAPNPFGAYRTPIDHHKRALYLFIFRILILRLKISFGGCSIDRLEFLESVWGFLVAIVPVERIKKKLKKAEEQKLLSYAFTLAQGLQN